MEGFFRLHAGLPRQGPGDRAVVDRALAGAGLVRDAVILDAGCGPGADVAGLLAHAPEGRVIGIDAHAPFIEEARERFAGEPRATFRAGDMREPGEAVDAVWSAGALYFLGLSEGIAAMATLLRPGGVLAFSYPAYVSDAASPEARAFWGDELPIPMEDEVRAAVRDAGLALIGDFRLPDAAWEAYYQPIEARIAAVAGDADDDLAEAIAAERAEIAAWRRVRDETGYLQITARRS